MRRRWVHLVFPLLVGWTTPSFAQPARAPLSPEAMRQDFDVLRAALEEAHGGLHRYVDRKELDRRLTAYRARLDRPLSHNEFAFILSEAIAEVRDGHAHLELDSLTARALDDAKVLPLRVALEDDRLVVRSNDAPNDSVVRPGMQLLSINGRPCETLIRTLLPAVSGDGFIETGKRARIAAGLPQLYWLFIEQTTSYRIVARNAAGRTVETTLGGITERERRSTHNPVNAELEGQLARLDAPAGNVALEWRGEPRVARLSVRAFDGEDFPSKLDSVFRVLRERGTTSLILDLRGNRGGVDEYGALLLSHLVDHPFRYFDRITVTTVAPSFATWLPRTFESMRTGTVADPGGGYRVTTALHTGVGPQPPAANPFLGKLVVLIDGGSFSTTADVAAHLRSWRRATFVGEETGGGYAGNTSGLNALIVLPNSRLKTKVMMYGYWNAVAPEPGGRGVVPEHVVPTRVVDLLRGTDRAMDVARTLVP